MPKITIVTLISLRIVIVIRNKKRHNDIENKKKMDIKQKST